MFAQIITIIGVEQCLIFLFALSKRLHLGNVWNGRFHILFLFFFLQKKKSVLLRKINSSNYSLEYKIENIKDVIYFYSGKTVIKWNKVYLHFIIPILNYIILHEGTKFIWGQNHVYNDSICWFLFREIFKYINIERWNSNKLLNKKVISDYFPLG